MTLFARLFRRVPAPTRASETREREWQREAERWPCVCCGSLTMREEPPGTYNICPVCFWEDDALQFDDPEREGGANGVSLRQARENYAEFGACDPRAVSHVRPARREEEP